MLGRIKIWIPENLRYWTPGVEAAGCRGALRALGKLLIPEWQSDLLRGMEGRMKYHGFMHHIVSELSKY